jgi:alkaline phosphatase D
MKMSERVQKLRASTLRNALLLTSLVLVGSGAFAQEPILGTPRILVGPMLGAVNTDSARIWMRVSGPYRVQVHVAEDQRMEKNLRKLEFRAEKERGCYLDAEIPGLEPGREYWYRVRVEGRNKYLNAPWRFRTAPQGPARFSIAYGSCARVQKATHQPIWLAVERARPDLFFWLGDNFYGDSLDPAVLEFEGLRQRDVPELQPLIRSVPQLATWDDHDFGINDYDRRHPAKQEALEFFRRYWANPSYGSKETPGVFFRYSYGGVDFFFVDCRYHRDPNSQEDTPAKTLLGKGQLEWLKKGLLASKAPFKLLVSGSGWSAAKGPGGDSWASFLHERDALFDWITAEKIGGVVLLSGDTHVGELNAIPWSGKGGYDFYDLVSSPLAQPSSGSWLRRNPEQRIRRVYFQGPNFGFVEFDMDREDPRLIFTLRDQRGYPVWKPLVLRASELQNGVESWKQKR